MVFGGDDDVLHAGGLGQGYNVVRAESGGVETGGEGFVFGDGDGGVIHDPFADAGDLLAVPRPGGNGVEAPVDEHAEARLSPPPHANVLLGRTFGVLDRGNRMIDRSAIGRGACDLRVSEGAGDKKKGDAESCFQGGPPGGFCCRKIVCENYLL